MAVLWPWNPTRIIREVKPLATNSGVVVVETDLGEGYLKTLGGSSDPHPLACELVGTMLAAWLGLRTLEYGVIEVDEEFRPTLANGQLAGVGPAFITRAEDGIPWGGKAHDLNALTNPEDVARLIVFDTWTQNCDRYLPREGGVPRTNLGNVFLSRDGVGGGRFTLKAIDQGCCFTCDRELTTRNLSATTDEHIYGFFPGFRVLARRDTALRAVDRLESITPQLIASFVSRIPDGWDVTAPVRGRLCDWIHARAMWVRRIIEREMPPADLFDDLGDREGRP